MIFARKREKIFSKQISSPANRREGDTPDHRAPAYQRQLLPITRRRRSDFGLFALPGQAKIPSLLRALRAFAVKYSISNTSTSLINCLPFPRLPSIKMANTSTRESILADHPKTGRLPSKGSSWPQRTCTLSTRPRMLPAGQTPHFSHSSPGLAEIPPLHQWESPKSVFLTF